MGLGMFAVHVLGWESTGFKAWHSPPMVVVFYLANGFGAAVAGFFGFWVVVMPLVWVGRKLYSAAWAVMRLLVPVPGVTTGERRVLVARVAPWAATLVICTATVAATGGFATIGFWVLVLVTFIPAAFNTAIVAPLVLIPLTILLAILGRLGRCLGLVKADWPTDVVTGRVVHATYVVVGILAWAGLGMGFAGSHEVRLPLADPVWGSLLVLAAAAAAGLAASVPIRRYRDRHLPGRRRTPLRAKDVAVEPTGEFWSPVPVSGWRAWYWNGHALHGVMQAWPDQSFTATCDSCPEVPGWAHSCGVYAATGRDNVAVFGPPDAMVVGRVELSGLVIEHDKGYRAEHARIVELFVASTELARTLAARYRTVEIHVENERSSY